MTMAKVAPVISGVRIYKNGYPHMELGSVSANQRHCSGPAPLDRRWTSRSLLCMVHATEVRSP